MDYAIFHRLHARHRRLSQMRRELKTQLDRAGAERPTRLVFRHAAVDRAMSKVERRLAGLRDTTKSAVEQTVS